MYSTIEVCVGEGKMCIKSSIIKTEDGVNIYIGGGEKSHVGTVVICHPRESLTGEKSAKCTTSVINMLGHKDDEIAKPICEEVCMRFKVTTVVTAGVHIDNASSVDIEKLKYNGKQLLTLILRGIEEQM